MLAELLRLELDKGVDVVVVHDGAQALETALAQPALRAVVLDLDMPRMNGVQAAACIRQDVGDVGRAILVGMSGDDNFVDAARRSGHFQLVVRKPIDFATMVQVLSGR